MTKDQQEKFEELMQRGHVRVDIMDAIRDLIDTVEEEAWFRGLQAGISPHDGSHPQQSI